MFTIHEVKGTLKVSTGEFVDIPYETLPVNQYAQRYNDIYIYLTTGTTVYGLPYAHVPLNVRNSSDLLSVYVEGITEATVPQLDLTPKYPTTKRLHYFSAWPYLDTLKQGNLEYHPDTDLTADELHDLWFTTTESLDEFRKNALFTVGGVIHKTDYSNDHGVILGATRTLNRMRTNSIGVLDFSELGGVEIVDLTEENLTKPKDTDRYISNTYVKLPDGLQGKTPYLVLGGKLVTAGRLLQVVSDDIVKINISSVDLVREYHLLEERTDTYLPVELNTEHSIINTSLRNDRYVKALLQSDYSFIILVGSDGLSAGLKTLGDSALPGVYYNATANLPIQYGNGYLADYVVDQIDVKGTTVKTYGYLNTQPIRMTGDPSNDVASVQQSKPVCGVRYQRALQLYLTKQTLE